MKFAQVAGFLYLFLFLKLAQGLKVEKIEIQALLDHQSGLIFYKDETIPACFVETYFDASPESAVLRFPLQGNGNGTKWRAPSSPYASDLGKMFCNGIPILSMDFTSFPPFPKGNSFGTSFNSLMRRRKRQAYGYYRSAPTGEARAGTSWNTPGQASQAQVQGQVFGSGIFSGQAQSQNGGVSQSQVQLSGVGIRGQIASSSGNAQAQLSLGNAAGSGQAAGLGQGPSSSQVQVSLGQANEESMASASAISGGSSAGVSGGSGTGGGYYHPGGAGTGTTIDAGGTIGGYRNGHGHGFTPGTRYVHETTGGLAGGANGASRTSFPNGASRTTYTDGAPRTSFADSGTGTSYTNGGGVPHYPRQIPGQAAQLGGLGGHGGSPLDTTTTLHQIPQVPSLQGAGLDQSSHGVRNGFSNGYSGHGAQGFPGGSLGPGSAIRGVGDTGVSGANGGVGAGGIPTSGIGLYGPGSSLPTSQSGVGTSQQIGTAVGNGAGTTGLSGGDHSGYPGDGGQVIDTGLRGVPLTRTNGVPQSATQGATGYAYRNGYATGGHPHVHSSTPGAYASSHGGIGQAQAQTVYFGGVGHGQYAPLGYYQDSQPGAGRSVTDGVSRYQEQQVGYGSVGQRQQIGGNVPTSGQNGRHVGPVTPVTSGQTGIRNGLPATHITTTNGHQYLGGTRGGTGATIPQRQVNGHSISNGHASGTPVTVNGQGSVHVPASTGTHTGTRYVNGHVISQPSSQLTPSTSYVPTSGFPQENGHRHTVTTSQVGRNGYHPHQTVTSSQVPAVRNGQPYRINGLGQVIPAGHTRHPVFPTTTTITEAGGGDSTAIDTSHATTLEQSGFYPSYGVSRVSPEDPDGNKCTIITFSCTIVVESNGRAKICKPNAVRMNGRNGGANGGVGGNGSKICCC